MSANNPSTLINLLGRDECRGLSRSRSRSHEYKSVPFHLRDEMLAKGWEVEKSAKRSVRFRKSKPIGAAFEDRVWMLFYRMGFSQLSGAGGAHVLVNGKDPNGPKTQIDVVGLDDEVAVAVECKCSESPARRPNFSSELAKHGEIRERFSAAVNKDIKGARRSVGLAMFLSNAVLSPNDLERAKEAKIVLFTERELEYYEVLTGHVGSAARFQFLADLFEGKSIPRLQIRIPAVKAKMGGGICYTFTVPPEYLLKIAYVSHRYKGKESDVSTYQRMLHKSRLVKIREYIEGDGIFPTNIVVNMATSRLRFERAVQESENTGGVLGWLEIRAAYKTAWVIDGQHRLFGYAGHPKAARSRVAVLAFENLKPSQQARLFIDINARQKSVKQSLLQELFAELHWDAAEPDVRVRAIVSKLVQDLDFDTSSPLRGRVQTADKPKDDKRCVSLTSLFGALEKGDLFIGKLKNKEVLEYGPLWAGTNEDTLERAKYIIRFWLTGIRDAAPDWWDLGASEGGGLAMNDSICACIAVLQSVLRFQADKGTRVILMHVEDVCVLLKPYLDSVAGYLGSLQTEDRKRYREFRGVQGQTARMRRMQQAINRVVPDFKPKGLQEFLDAERGQTKLQAKELIDKIELLLQRIIMQELQEYHGVEHSEWWLLGIPRKVRLKATNRFEEDDGKRGAKENYFDLIDYRDIITEQWDIFKRVFSFEKSGSKATQTGWLVRVNDVRKLVAHASSGATISIEQVEELRNYFERLDERSVKRDLAVSDGAIEEE